MKNLPQLFLASDGGGSSSQSSRSSSRSGSSSGSCYCGPDLTAYMLSFINAACASQNAALFKQYINSGSQDQYNAAIMNLGGVFGIGESWNFSGYIVNFGTTPPSLWARTSGCPAGNCADCNLAVTLCRYCFDYTVPGRIIYGYVGRYLGVSSDLLQAVWPIVLNGGMSVITAPDAAISAGIALYSASPTPPVDLSAVCPAISPFFQSMDIRPSCRSCSVAWSGALPS